MGNQLTERQAQVLQFIRDEIRDTGCSPTVREIGDAVGMSSSASVHRHLINLEEKGYLRRDPNKPRAIELLGAAIPPGTHAPIDDVQEPSYVEG